MRILSLDCQLGLHGEVTDDFRSTASLFDFDLVFWDPQETLKTYREYGEYRGYPSLNSADSAAFQRDVARRRKEIEEFLALGRVLVVFMPGDVTVYVDTGQRQYSGTGKNRQTTRIVASANVMDALPIKIARTPAAGTAIEPASEVVRALFRQTQESWSYRCLISGEKSLAPLFYVKGTKKMVGGIVEHPGDGTLILLPDFLPEDDQMEASHKALVEWVSGLTTGAEEDPPTWLQTLLFPSEIERNGVRAELEAAMAELAKKLAEAKAGQAVDDQWKVLISGTGAPLERVVEKALTLFGFAIETHERGRSDIRANYQGQAVVVEVKGVSKSASEKNAAQLEKWVSAEMAEGRSAKGILVVNSWRDLPMDKRTDPTFPNQMVPYSEQRNHCLVSGLQLLVMARTCLADPSRADECARALVDTCGVVTGWDELSDIFESQEVAQESAS